MPGIDYRAVRSQVSIARVLQLLGFAPIHINGDEVRGACPIHGSTSPRSRSFAAHLGKNAYFCFKCRSAGNQLDLWAAATRQSLHEGTRELCEKLHLPIPWLHQW